MRMRRKKNLEPRLENCKEYLIDVPETKFEYGVEPEKQLLDFEQLFGNSNPVRLEIGCGKGQFAMEIAAQNPDINFIAVEINRNVIVQACEKAKQAELKNIRFFIMGAEHLDLYIPENSVELIYLNFSCPFPKKRYAKHRLTHSDFLEIYKRILKPDGEIHQKTDNMHFFEFSLSEYSKCGFLLENVSLDLHNSGFEGNIMTEYEKRFTDLGQPIYRVEAKMR
ncbi:MAG: tRNA (guanosine(46)-N7)-methyltransferase TrmB [Faecalibacterium sp.]|nr:tRNA (guanosine(46)-N7)-methyltransferase TrmB [Ruminococcus sp.]MCM1392012.1 tRNA (guanosine(46)-N7)-methyltransferase TrmB [Ruminococcus sp.]MCM1485728.1 tRNA (guanosine(46)-N7)-methyltransferase TrmB [Faecalibacterium sp.]